MVGAEQHVVHVRPADVLDAGVGVALGIADEAGAAFEVDVDADRGRAVLDGVRAGAAVDLVGAALAFDDVVAAEGTDLVRAVVAREVVAEIGEVELLDRDELRQAGAGRGRPRSVEVLGRRAGAAPQRPAVLDVDTDALRSAASAVQNVRRLFNYVGQAEGHNEVLQIHP